MTFADCRRFRRFRRFNYNVGTEGLSLQLFTFWNLNLYQIFKILIFLSLNSEQHIKQQQKGPSKFCLMLLKQTLWIVAATLRKQTKFQKKTFNSDFLKNHKEKKDFFHPKKMFCSTRLRMRPLFAEQWKSWKPFLAVFSFAFVGDNLWVKRKCYLNNEKERGGRTPFRVSLINVAKFWSR